MDEAEFAVCIFGHEDHALGHDVHHLAGGKVGDEGYLFAGDGFGCVVFGYTGEDGAGVYTGLYRQFEELVALLHFLGFDDLAYADVELGEVVEYDLWFEGFYGARSVGGFSGLGCRLGSLLLQLGYLLFDILVLYIFIQELGFV